MVDKPIRVLHVLGRLDRGGAESMVMNYYRNIDRTIVQFDFLLHTSEHCDFTDEVLSLGGHLYNIPRLRPTNYLQYRKSLHLFFRDNASHFSIVHGHMGRNAAIYLSIAKKYGLFTIAHSHGTKNTPDIRGLLYKVMAYPTRFVADYFFGCSAAAGKSRYGKRIADSERFAIIKNSFPVRRFQFDEKKREEIQKAYDIDGKFVIGHVGRLIQVKNHVFMLEILQLLLKKKPDVVLFLVGDGPMKSHLENEISKLDLSKQVVFAGSQPNVSDYLQAMDIFLFPSLYEGLGSAVIEAQANGLPCVVSDTVPNEVAITDLVTFMSLKDPIEEWVEMVASKSYARNRKEYNEEVNNSGYDIHQASKLLEKFYLERGYNTGMKGRV